LVVGEGARSHSHPQRGDMFLCLLRSHLINTSRG
jgi:hypothetical protein